jgi:DNA-binding IclR family transcriptional regulator
MLQTVSRAMQSLLALAEHREGLSLTELARAINSSKATAHRIVKTLKEFDFVGTTASTGKLRLGPGLLILSHRVPPDADIRELAHPRLDWLRDKTEQTACLHLPLGRERVCVAQAESHAELKWVAAIGQRFPLTAGAPGKVLVAFLPDEERERVLRTVPLTRFTPDSITDRRQFERALDQVRRDGYAIAVNENVAGSAACSAPVWDSTGRVAAAITVVGSANRLSRGHLRSLSKVVRRAANALSQDLKRKRSSLETVGTK